MWFRATGKFIMVTWPAPGQMTTAAHEPWNMCRTSNRSSILTARSGHFPEPPSAGNFRKHNKRKLSLFEAAFFALRQLSVFLLRRAEAPPGSATFWTACSDEGGFAGARAADPQCVPVDAFLAGTGVQIPHPPPASRHLTIIIGRHPKKRAIPKTGWPSLLSI